MWISFVLSLAWPVSALIAYRLGQANEAKRTEVCEQGSRMLEDALKSQDGPPTAPRIVVLGREQGALVPDCVVCLDGRQCGLRAPCPDDFRVCMNPGEQVIHMGIGGSCTGIRVPATIDRFRR